MKRFAVTLGLALCAAVVGVPGRAGAQCHQVCYDIKTPDGKIIGHGCIWDSDSNTNCLANASLCITGDCGGAFLTDGNGAVLAEADICRDKVTIRSVSARVAARARPPVSDEARGRPTADPPSSPAGETE